MIKTPNSMRLHIGIFGKTNSGKSSLINALMDQEVSIVSDISGTTTDLVTKAMELPGLGPVVLIDSPGYDDSTILGKKRQEVTEKAIEKCDIALFLFSKDLDKDISFIEKLKKKELKIITILSKADFDYSPDYLEKIKDYQPIKFSIYQKDSIKDLIGQLSKIQVEEEEDLTKGLVEEKDLVLLVMPQDIQAPKGRLILAQVQTIRNLLDKKALVLATTLENFQTSLTALKNPPSLIITDSQCFKEVYDQKPKESMLTSFSVLFSKLKGDINYFVDSVKVLDENFSGKILICEACTHSPLEEDIGRIKIPRLLKAIYGEKIQIDFSRGGDFWERPDYSLVVHCGGCMLNRKTMENRIKKAQENKIPMTNYGILLAYLKGILDKITY